MLLKFIAPTLILFYSSATAIADSFPPHPGSVQPGLIKIQSHAGQMDTDGILSQGEIPNPNINYDRAQRQKEDRGDSRVNNPYNDAAAAEDRYYKHKDEQYYKQEDRDREQEERERHNRRELEKQSRPWWNW